MFKLSKDVLLLFWVICIICIILSSFVEETLKSVIKRAIKAKNVIQYSQKKGKNAWLYCKNMVFYRYTKDKYEKRRDAKC